MSTSVHRCAYGAPTKSRSFPGGAAGCRRGRETYPSPAPSDGVTDPVDPPKADPLDVAGEASVSPRPYADLVTGVMEARDCAKPVAEDWVDEHGREAAERLLLARWA